MVVAGVRAFLRFWYDFLIGEDWRIAAAVVLALALVGGLGRAGVAAWWVLPVALATLLPLSLWPVTRSAR
jgi:hypothetical protein